MEKIYWDRFWCTCKDLKSDELLNIEKAKELVEWADIIYEWWGSTQDVINSWQESWFDKILKEAWKKWKVMCGLSAWANCWFKECSSDSLQIKYWKDQPLIRMNCLGFLDWLFVPHCDEEDRQEHVKELLKKESDEIWLLFSNCAALEVIDDQYRVLTTDASNYPIEKAFWKKHIEKIESISKKISKNLQNLKNYPNYIQNYNFIYFDAKMKYFPKISRGNIYLSPITPEDYEWY